MKQIKLLIVDDDYTIRALLKGLINDFEDYVLIGEAINGKEAMSIYKREKPDIIISDIRMPLMDGIQLQKELKSDDYEGELLMLSNYDDFTYVKEALNNGAIDYLLKHQLSPQLLHDILQKAKERLAKKKTSVILRKSIAEDYNLLKIRFMKKVLRGEYTKNHSLQKDIDDLGLNINTHKVVVILFKVMQKEYIGEQGVKEQSLMQFSIQNIVSEVLKEFDNGFVCLIDNVHYGIFLSFQNISSERTMQESLKKLIQKVAYCLKEYLKVDTKFAYSSVHSNVLQIHEEYDAMTEQLREHFISGDSLIIKQVDEACSAHMDISLEMEKKCIRNIEEGNIEAVTSFLDVVFTDLNNVSFHRDELTLLINELIAILLRVMKRNQQVLSSSWTDSVKKGLSQLNNYQRLEDLKRRIFTFYWEVTEAVGHNPYTNYSTHICNCLDYIKEHYKNQVSLDRVAEHVGITTVYLSRLFKSEVGVGFSEYLQNYRLERAKELLLTSNNIKEAALESGFHNYTYFLTQFKKRTGLTPSQYIHVKRI